MEMNRDYTLAKYGELCLALLDSSYTPLTVESYLTGRQNNTEFIILRHDIDRKPMNALKMAELEHELGVKSTYYFRHVKGVFKAEIIHEIGYHYEVLDKAKGNFDIILLVSFIYICVTDIRLVDAYAKLRRTFHELKERDAERELEEAEICR